MTCINGVKACLTCKHTMRNLRFKITMTDQGTWAVTSIEEPDLLIVDPDPVRALSKVPCVVAAILRSRRMEIAQNGTQGKSGVAACSN